MLQQDRSRRGRVENQTPLPPLDPRWLSQARNLRSDDIAPAQTELGIGETLVLGSCRQSFGEPALVQQLGRDHRPEPASWPVGRGVASPCLSVFSCHVFPAQPPCRASCPSPVPSMPENASTSGAGPPPAADIERALAALLAWYDQNRRTLPWRAEPGAASDPYAVLVSEIMLQQTTVETVKGRYAAFLQRFPTVEALAAAPLDDVLHAWQGLGYYRRARGLHACAQTLASGHGGRFPTTAAALLNLPGIGPYTSAAIAAIAFKEPILALDANVERVLARLHDVRTPLPKARKELRQLAEAWRPRARPGDTLQAFMDLGSAICRSGKPACLACPLQDCCAGCARGTAASLPTKPQKPARPERDTVAFLLRRSDGSIWLRRRPDKGVLAGLIELPSTPWTASIADLTTALPTAPLDAAWRPVPGAVRHVFTHFALTIRLATADCDASPDDGDGFWQRPERFTDLALPTLTKKVLAHAAGCGLLSSVGTGATSDTKLL